MPAPSPHIESVMPPSRGRGIAAFSLIEVVLAIGIATGLLVVALLFYRQAAELRGQILREADRFSTIRLTLDRLAGDLRAARAETGGGFAGDSSSLSFVKTAFNFPQTNSLTPDTGLRADLVQVFLSVVMETNGDKMAMAGLQWHEEPFLSGPPPQTNLVLLATTADPVQSVTNAAEPLLDAVKFVRFRYWDGSGWQSGWTNQNPPPGVEIVFATEGLPDDATTDDYPPDPFRRVVLIPSGKARRQRQTQPAPTTAPVKPSPRRPQSSAKNA